MCFSAGKASSHKVIPHKVIHVNSGELFNLKTEFLGKTNSTCWRFSIQENKWFSKAAEVDEFKKKTSWSATAYAFHGETNRLYMAGGYSSEEGYDCVLYTEDGSTFHSMPKMPEPQYMNSMAVLKSGNIFVSGGMSTESCFLFECEMSNWKVLPAMTKDRVSTSCGVIKNAETGKEEVVVAGGSDVNGQSATVEIYSFEESRWRSGS
jgi:hypothetical protein